MVRINVPASSANLGSGFDSLGIALNLYNYIEMSENDFLNIYSLDGSFVPKNDGNLIYSSAKKVFDLCGKSFKGLKVGQKNNIPFSRGLGSSSACIAGGILGANTILGNPLNTQDMLNLACEIEKHPDNIAPTILGGFVVSVLEDKKVYAVNHCVDENINFIALVPNFKLSTKKSRLVLPKIIKHKSAVFNLSRASLLTAAFCEGKYDLLEVATKDLLHQNYRLPLISGGKKVMKLAEKCGANACFLSGSGPTIMAIVIGEIKDFETKLKAELLNSELTSSYEIKVLNACNKGVHTIIN